MAEVAFDPFGEFAELGGARQVLPASRYPVVLTVSDAAIDPDREGVDPQGEAVVIPAAPYVNVTGLIYAGPFEGFTVERRQRLTTGPIGNYFAFLKGITKAITGQPANLDALRAAGFIPPPQGRLNDGDWGKLTKEKVAEFFLQLAPAKRVSTMAAVCRVAQWSTKKVIAKVGMDTYDSKKIDPKTGAPYQNTVNPWLGFFRLDDVKNGFSVVEAQDFPQQAIAKTAMGL